MDHHRFAPYALALALALLLPLLACGGGGRRRRGGGGRRSAPPPPNSPPRVALALSSIHTSAGGGTSSHTVNPGAFVDPEGDALAVTADRPDGSPLPDWVTFDATRMRITLDKDAAPIGTTTIRIRATDPAGGTAQFLTALNVSGGPLPTGRTLVSRPDGPGQGNGDSDRPAISGLGTHVTFQTRADNLHPAQASGDLDVLVRHVGTGAMEQANSNAGGIDGSRSAWDPVISFDGRQVAFVDETPWFGSLLDDIYDVFLKHLDTGDLTLISSVPTGTPDGHSGKPSISAEGGLVAFDSRSSLLVPGDTNDKSDAFTRDPIAGETTRESRARGAPQGSNHSRDAVLSADGRFVAFATAAGELVGLTGSITQQVVLQDRSTGAIELISRNAADEPADLACGEPTLSADGRFVAFSTAARNLDPRDSDTRYDIYVRDRWTNEIRRVTQDSEGFALPGPGGFGSFHASLSADGRFLAFETSEAPLSQDDNGANDVYVLDLHRTHYRWLTQRTVAGVTPGTANRPSLSANAAAVACTVRSDDMSASDTNDAYDVWWLPTSVRGGTHRDDDLQGTSEDDWLRGLTGHDKISGSEGDDLIEPGPGFDELRGGLGIDTYLWWRADEGLDHVVDFQTGFLGDRLDLRRLLPAGAATTPENHVRFTDDGLNVTVSVDVDGPGGPDAFVPLVVLQGVAPFTLQDALDDGQVLLP